MKLSLYIIPALLISIGLGIHGKHLQAIGQQLDEKERRRDEMSRINRLATTDARQQEINSDQALRIFQSGCISIVDAKTGKEVRMMESQFVTVAQGEKTAIDNGERICNSLGDAAIVVNGKPTNIVRIGPQHEKNFCPYQQAIQLNLPPDSVQVKQICSLLSPKKED